MYKIKLIILFSLISCFSCLNAQKKEKVREIFIPGPSYVINPEITKRVRFEFLTNNSNFDFKQTIFTIRYWYRGDKPVHLNALIDSISISVEKRYNKGHLYWELYVDSISQSNKISWGAINCISPNIEIDSSYIKINNDKLEIYFTLINRKPGYAVVDISQSLEVVLKIDNNVIDRQFALPYKNKNSSQWPNSERFDYHFSLNAPNKILYFEVDPNDTFIKREDKYIFPFKNGFKTLKILEEEIAIELAQQCVTVQNPNPIYYNCNDIYFKNKNEGWLLGFYGVLLETKNGGRSWQKKMLKDLDQNFQYENTDYQYIGATSMYFANKNHGWILAHNKENNGIFKTNDGGKNWKWKIIHSNFKRNHLTKIYFLDRNIGWFVGGNANGEDWAYDSWGIVGKTTDGGHTWEIIQIRNTKNSDGAIHQGGSPGMIGPVLKDVFFANHLLGFAIGGNQVLKTTDGGNNWHKLDLKLPNLDKPEPYDIRYMELFVNEKVGWITGTFHNRSTGISSIFIFKTIDSGKNWRQQKNPTDTNPDNFDVMDLHFLNKSDGWIIGSQFGRMKRIPFSLHTKSGGEEWTKYKTPSNVILQKIHYINKDIGIAASRGSIYLKHNDKNWKSVNSITDIDLNNVLAIDENRAIIVGNSGTLLETDNGGEQWHRASLSTSSHLNNITKSSKGTIWVIGDSGIVLKKGYDEVTWSRIPIPLNQNLNSIHFITEEIGFIVGDSSKIIKTCDGGLNWKPLKIFSSKNIFLHDIYFLNINDGFLFVKEKKYQWVGYIYKTKDGGKSWKKVDFTERVVIDVNLKPHIFFKNDFGYAVVLGKVYRISNSGMNWDEISIDPKSTHKFKDIEVINPNFMAVLDTFGNLYIYSEKNCWQKIILQKIRLLKSISFANDKVGWIVGDCGYIARINLR